MAYWQINNVALRGVTGTVPNNLVKTAELSIFTKEEADLFDATVGIKNRYIAPDHICASDLCFEAAELIINTEQIDRSSFDGLVFVSEHPDFHGPATSCVLQGRLGLPKDCVCFDINYGCSGYIYGIFQAATLIGSGACNKVLVLAGNTNSKTVEKDRKSS